MNGTQNTNMDKKEALNILLQVAIEKANALASNSQILVKAIQTLQEDVPKQDENTVQGDSTEKSE